MSSTVLGTQVAELNKIGLCSEPLVVEADAHGNVLPCGEALLGRCPPPGGQCPAGPRVRTPPGAHNRRAVFITGPTDLLKLFFLGSGTIKGIKQQKSWHLPSCKKSRHWHGNEEHSAARTLLFPEHMIGGGRGRGKGAAWVSSLSRRITPGSPP